MNKAFNEFSTDCPACGRNSSIKLGRLRCSDGIIKLPDPGNLYQCPNCSLLFRRPYFSPEALAQLYQGLSSDLWKFNERAEFNIATDIICNSFTNGRVLDVGCFAGDFLDSLPRIYQRYGLEVADESRKIAEKRSVKLIGETIEQLKIKNPTFHAITLFDVIEHLPYPLLSLQRLSKAMLREGILILSTGNTDALPWRLMRQDYWYYFPEHVSFFNPSWFLWAADQLGLKLIKLKKFSHLNGSFYKRWRQFAQCLSFWVINNTCNYPKVKKFISTLYPFNRAAIWPSAPLTNMWKDHILVVLKSKE